MFSAHPRIAIDLKPRGLEQISSDAVEIFPVPRGVSLISTFMEQPVPRALSGEYAHRLLSELPRERDFLAREAKSIVPEYPHEADLITALKFFSKNGLATLLGLRDIRLVGNELAAKHFSQLHPIYRMFSQERNSELQVYASPVGTNALVRTADEKFIFQDRNPQNRVYGGVPGASFAGLMDARLVPNQGRVDIFDAAKRQLKEEGREEIGFELSSTDQFEVVALAIDRRAVHHEIIMLLRTALTAEEVVQNAAKATGNSSGSRLRENFVILDASPEAIQILLTESRTPFPSTHAASLLMAGHALVQENTGAFVEAQRWLTDIIPLMDANYSVIDHICSSGRYDPLIPPEAQGLPGFKAELSRIFELGSYQYVNCGW